MYSITTQFSSPRIAATTTHQKRFPLLLSVRYVPNMHHVSCITCTTYLMLVYIYVHIPIMPLTPVSRPKYWTPWVSTWTSSINRPPIYPNTIAFGVLAAT